MKLGEYKRVKQHAFPGDVPKQIKIAMREGKLAGKENRAKTYRNVVEMRTRATLKQRMKWEVGELEDELDTEFELDLPKQLRK